ncbi:unnamed protein product [Calicophoron daubneyi]|uniref:BTB domain-containing protein n=1 Tax=Calicophoron daubneyi TaxID=300641 RepID=A0AAV2TKQ5_CALDB
MSDTIIELNVGGKVYATTRQTIEKIPNAYLSTIIHSKEALKDQERRFFIDRDGALFRYILDFYRYGPASIPRKLPELDRLREEAVFYGLPEMKKHIEDFMSAEKRNKTNHSCITIGYRGTFGLSKDGTNDLRFRKLTRILVAGQTAECRRVFGESLNDTRDPDTGSCYSCRFFLKHTILESAFDALYENGYELVGCCASGTNGCTTDAKPGQNAEEACWQHYNEFIFVRNG